MFHHTNKKIAFYTNIKNKDVTLYNGSEYDEITEQEKIDILKKPYSCDFILVKYDGKNIEKDYKDYIDEIERIKILTNGKINMYQTGTYSNTAICLFNSMNKIKSIAVNKYEIPFLENGGGVRYAKAYVGKAYKYDICSCYPAIMKSKTFKVPINKGTLTSISTETINKKRYLQYGIYNVSITCDDRLKFTTQSSNMYSHIEVNYAKQLNLTIESIGEHLIFNSDDLVTGYSIFNEFVTYMFDMKKKDKVFKKILNTLWGGLTAKSGGIRTVNMLYSEIDTRQNQILKMSPINDNNNMCEVTIKYPVLFYKSNYARLNAFILGTARVNMHKTFDKIGYDTVLFSHTDSIITNKRIQYDMLKFGDDLGMWKFEGVSQNCKVVNMNKYTFPILKT